MTIPRKDIGKLFHFLPCLHLLRYLPKFQAASSPTKTTSEVPPKVEEMIEDSAESREKESTRKARPEGRQEGEDELVTRQMRTKKIKPAESVVKLQEMQLAEIKRRNEILLFTNGPGGATSARAQKYINLKQKEVLQATRKERGSIKKMTPPASPFLGMRLLTRTFVQFPAPLFSRLSKPLDTHLLKR